MKFKNVRCWKYTKKAQEDILLEKKRRKKHGGRGVRDEGDSGSGKKKEKKSHNRMLSNKKNPKRERHYCKAKNRGVTSSVSSRIKKKSREEVRHPRRVKLKLREFGGEYSEE